MKKTLIYLDPGEPLASLDLLGVMDEIYGRGESSAWGLCPGTPCEKAMAMLDYVVTVEADALEPHDTVRMTNCIEELQEKHAFDAILIPATTFGRMLAPRAAMRLNVGLVADVTAIRHKEGEIEMVRPAFSGRMMAGVVTTGRLPVMMTVRRNVFSCGKRSPGRAKVLKHAPRVPERPAVRLVERRPAGGSHDIRDSDVLVSGGGGVLQSFDQLESLARALGGMVSASRKVVDSGRAPRHVQVGQSGRTVSPRLYLALGISGSIQHVVGLRNAEHIIAVNPSRDAPICSLSDIVVEGDAREFIPRMIARIEQGAGTVNNTGEGDNT